MIIQKINVKNVIKIVLLIRGRFLKKRVKKIIVPIIPKDKNISIIATSVNLLTMESPPKK